MIKTISNNVWFSKLFINWHGKSKTNTSDGKRHIPYDFSHVWNKKPNKINDETKQKQRCGYRNQSSGNQKGESKMD